MIPLGPALRDQLARNLARTHTTRARPRRAASRCGGDRNRRQRRRAGQRRPLPDRARLLRGAPFRRLGARRTNDRRGRRSGVPALPPGRRSSAHTQASGRYRAVAATATRRRQRPRSANSTRSSGCGSIADFDPRPARRLRHAVRVRDHARGRLGRRRRRPRPRPGRGRPRLPDRPPRAVPRRLSAVHDDRGERPAGRRASARRRSDLRADRRHARSVPLGWRSRAGSTNGSTASSSPCSPGASRAAHGNRRTQVDSDELDVCADERGCPTRPSVEVRSVAPCDAAASPSRLTDPES